MNAHSLRTRFASAAALALVATALSPVSAAPRTASPARAASRVTGSTPLVFEPDIAERFRARVPGGAVFLTPSEVVVTRVDATPPESRGLPGAVASLRPARSVPAATVRMQFVASAPSARLVGVDRRREVVNYLIGRDPAAWRRNVPTYDAVAARGLYPGIDLRYDSTRTGALKGTYVVAPGADPAVIAWRYRGATATLRPGGDLAVDGVGGRSPALHLVDRAPVAWQSVAGVRWPVQIGYELRSDRTLGFAIGGYDRTRPLVIDPEVVYSRLPGDAGAMTTGAWDVATDKAGAVYLVGDSLYVRFPDPHLPSYVEDWDAVVQKVDAAGRTVFSTIIGGQFQDDGRAIALDGRGVIHLTGSTRSSDFPVVRAVQSRLKSTSQTDVWAAALDPSGSGLRYSTYLGSRGADYGNDIAVTQSGTAYVGGWAAGADYPVRGASRAGRMRRGLADTVVTKLSASGALLASTYAGTDGDDWAYAIALDRAGNVYLAGIAGSCDFPTRHVIFRCHNGGFVGGRGGGFALKLPPTLSALTWAAYIDGTEKAPSTYDPYSPAVGITVDRTGAVYVVGLTTAGDFPVTDNAVQGRFGGGVMDGYLLKFDQRRGRVLYGTYLGGGGDGTSDALCHVAVDGAGRITVSGTSSSADYPVYRAVQPFNMGAHDAVLTTLTADGQLISSTFWGGTGEDNEQRGGALALDAAGNPVLAGRTHQAVDFPTYDSERAIPFPVGDVFVASFRETPDAALVPRRIGPPPPPGHSQRSSNFGGDRA
jgi:hypothetical protein